MKLVLVKTDNGNPEEKKQCHSHLSAPAFAGTADRCEPAQAGESGNPGLKKNY
jgi:hypothetical protein